MEIDYGKQWILEGRSVIKNAFAIFSLRLLLPLLNFLLFVLIARFLGVSDFGQYSLLLALVVMFQSFQILGLQQYIIKKITPDKTTVHKYACGISLIGLLVTLIFYICVCLYVNVAAYSAVLIRISYIYALTLFSNLGIIILESLFVAYEKVKYNAYAIILGTVLGMVLAFIALYLGCGLNIIIYILTVTSYITFCLSFYLFTKYVSKIKVVIDFSLIRVLLEKAKIFCPIALLMGIWKMADIVILSKIGGADAVGLYNAGKKFFTLLLLVPYSIGLALFPILSKYYNKSSDFFATFFKKFLAIITIFVLPLAILMIFLTDKVIFAVYGKNFSDAELSMRILLSAAVFISLSFAISVALIAAGKQKYDLITFLIADIAFITFGIVLSARYGKTGMAVAYLATSVIFFILHYYFARRHVFKKDFFLAISKPVLSTAIMVFVMYLFRGFNYIAVSFISLAVYFTALFMMRTLTRQDIFLFRNILLSFFNRQSVIYNAKE